MSQHIAKDCPYCEPTKPKLNMEKFLERAVKSMSNIKVPDDQHVLRYKLSALYGYLKGGLEMVRSEC